MAIHYRNTLLYKKSRDQANLFNVGSISDHTFRAKLFQNQTGTNRQTTVLEFPPARLRLLLPLLHSHVVIRIACCLVISLKFFLFLFALINSLFFFLLVSFRLDLVADGWCLHLQLILVQYNTTVRKRLNIDYSFLRMYCCILQHEAQLKLQPRVN